MGALGEFTKDLLGNEEGAALVEYTVLLGIMLVAGIVMILAVGQWVSTKWTAFNANLATA
jgi:pilus assembly protein Flp/PilA